MDLVRRDAAPAMRVISHLVLHFIAAFPLPREDVRIPAAYAGARLATERIAEFYGGRLIYSAAIRGHVADGAAILDNPHTGTRAN